ncbi:MAG: carbohydrate ABC transporter permease, partial [Syntrophomonadaceae bacterium]|nr:carbohydrate ABC transporter permease [Syntrophomonadaceae bacterium]
MTHARRTERWQSWSLRRRVGRVVLHIILLTLAITFLAPMVWMVLTSLKKNADVFITPIRWLPKVPQWQNYREIFEVLPLTSFIRNSFFVTILGTLGTVVSSLVVAYSLSRLRWRGREFVFNSLLATMMLPGIVVLVPQFIMFFKVGWIDKFEPLIVPAWFGNSFYIFMLRQFMRGLPLELDEAARIDGATSFRILVQLITPMCKPAITAVIIFAGMSFYNDFMGPLLYLSSNDKFTLPLGIYWYQGRYGQFWHLVMAASTVSVLPLVTLFFVAQKHFVQGFTF